MSQSVMTNEEWLKVLGKGMITIPKRWRKDLGIAEGDIVKAKREGKRVVIEPQLEKTTAYRVYSDEEIDVFLADDQLPDPLAEKVKTDLARRGKP